MEIQPKTRPTLSLRRAVETPKSMRQMRKALESRWPDLFDKRRPVPLAIGIHEQIIAATGFDEKRVHRFLAYWTHRSGYLRALDAGIPRAGLTD